MDIKSITNPINAYQNQGAVSASAQVDSGKTNKDKVVADKNTIDKNATEAAIYDRSSLVVQMKNDLAQRTSQLQNMVKEMMSTQAGIKTAKGDDVWKFLAGGNFTVTADAKAAAQEAISDDGYWGVNKTADRIFQFAQAISGGDTSKAELLKKAVTEGFQKATGAWGKELPDISKKTYEAVMDKFDKWTQKDTAKAAAIQTDVL
ncbi:MAG: hypothetical protein RSC69_03880 [Lachnospiraceae bacterium]